MKRKPTEWEKILAYDVTDKGVISKVYRPLMQTQGQEGKQADQIKNNDNNSRECGHCYLAEVGENLAS